MRDGEIWVNLNDSQDNKSGLQRVVKELKSKLRKVKEDNERILKSQEELLTILLAKIHNDEKEKIKGFEHDICNDAHFIHVKYILNNKIVFSSS